MGANFYCYYFSRQSEASTTSTSGESDVVMAEYNLDMGRWVCPTSNANNRNIISLLILMLIPDTALAVTDI